MSDEPKQDPVNFVLEWRGESQDRRSQGAREEFAPLSEEAVAEGEMVVQPEPEAPDVEAVPDSLVETPTAADPEPALDESPEYFEWTAERERSIQRLLEAAPEGNLPTVHVQLSDINQDLKNGKSIEIQLELGLDGGLVMLDDTTVLEKALQILRETEEKITQEV